MHKRPNPHISISTYHETPHDEVVQNIGNLLGVYQKKLKVEPCEEMSALAQYNRCTRIIQAQPFLLDYRSDFQHPRFQDRKYMREEQGGVLTKEGFLKEALTHEQAHDYFCQAIEPQLVLLMQEGLIRLPRDTTIDTYAQSDQPLEEILGTEAAKELLYSTMNSQLTALNEAFAEWITSEICGYKNLFEEQANDNAAQIGYDGATLKFFYEKFHELSKEHGAMTVAYNMPGIVKEYLNTREDITLELRPRKIIFIEDGIETSTLHYRGNLFPKGYIFATPKSQPTTVFAVHPDYKTVD